MAWKSASRRDAFQNVVILSGAGISRESGLDTFRDPDGIWARVNVDDVASPAGFARNPALVHGFYNLRRQQLLSGAIHPNAAHLSLANLQRSWEGDVTVITQNIDDLHERAGTLGVIHIHGELLKARCTACDKSTECKGDLSPESTCSSCRAVGEMRPDVVWFGEIARSSGARTVELNLEQSLGASLFHEAVYGPASKIVPEYVEALLLKRLKPTMTEQ